jgi:hypothetical protein
VPPAISRASQVNEDGEIVETKAQLYLHEARICEEEQYDGYYAIVTSDWKAVMPTL